MPNLFFGIKDDKYLIFDEHETVHFKTVRKKENDIIECTDGKGYYYKVKIAQIGKKKSFGEILESKYIENNEKTFLALFAPASRWERLRWLIEKSVELGVDNIYITKTAFSNRDYKDKVEKINMVIRDSAKQCVRFHFPNVDFINFKDIKNHVTKNTYFLDFNGQKLPSNISSDVSIIVGPEGGFSKEERDFLFSNFNAIRLGNKILRFETAAFVALSYFAIVLNKI
ncbi:MAG TPA: 16S rRNA (uracil(1498)-N(3))-methyltransferase [Thermosipho africanus]|nr:16S rRNA (uracil(1498)-N(3))-methyltransferase [Thermosipho africanus]